MDKNEITIVDNTYIAKDNDYCEESSLTAYCASVLSDDLKSIMSVKKEQSNTSDWISVKDKLPDVFDVRILLIDGSEINCCVQSDGDYYWKCGGSEIFIPSYKVTHWKPLGIYGQEFKLKPDLTQSIFLFGFTIRTRNCLLSKNIETVGDLIKWSDIELLKIPHLGKKSIREITDSLSSIGLSLRSNNYGSARKAPAFRPGMNSASA